MVYFVSIHRNPTVGDGELKRKGSMRMKVKRSDSEVGGMEPVYRDHCYAQDITCRPPKRRLTDDASTSTPTVSPATCYPPPRNV